MSDVQNQKPENEIELRKVGVTGLRKYLTIKRPGRTYTMISSINCYIKLASEFRGAHMSRFGECVEESPSETSSVEDFAESLSKIIKEKHGSHACVEVSGEIPFRRNRPNGGEEEGIAQIRGEYSTEKGKKRVGISLNGALACPCGKEMCNGVTHNQRSNLTVSLDVSEEPVEMFDVIDICMQSFSSPVFTTLKRPEEKQVIEKMHENPKFVEDVVRDCVQILKENFPGRKCKVECTSFESIHDHNAFSEWSGKL